MSDQLKFVLDTLNAAPFKKNYNLISFDSIPSEQLLQVLNDVLAEIDPKQKIDIREESADQTTVRIMQCLQIFKYKPPTDADGLNEFRQGLVLGKKAIIYPLLEWLLRRLDDLKERAYLGRFLKKVEIPFDLMQDDEVAALFGQYEEAIDEFKEAHSGMTELKKSGFNTAEVRKDIEKMEEESEQVQRRTERLKQKVQRHQNVSGMLDTARSLRLARDKSQELAQQKNEMRNMIALFEQKIQRIKTQIYDVRQSNQGATPATIMEKLETDVRANTILASEQYPRQLAALKRYLRVVQEVTNETAMGPQDIQQIKTNIAKLHQEMQSISERRMQADASDEKLVFFRKQVNQVAAKKEQAALKLSEVHNEYASTEGELVQRRDEASKMGLGETVRPEEFKVYVAAMRSKNAEYKEHKTELADYRAEVGILTRTVDLLTAKDDHIQRQLEKEEAKAGVTGIRSTQERLEKVSSKKAEMDEQKNTTLESMSGLVVKLHKAVNEKKAALTPLVQEIRPLRTQFIEAQQAHSERKAAYDNVNAGLEAQRAKLEQEVRQLREQCQVEESRHHHLCALYEQLSFEKERVDEEVKKYSSADPQDRKRTYREFYTRRIGEQEKLGKTLKEQQRDLRDNAGHHQHQVSLWTDVLRLLEAKSRFKQTASNITDGVTHVEDNRLVL